MVTTQWAFDLIGNLPAHLVTTDAVELEAQVQMHHAGQRSPSQWQEMTIAGQNGLDTRPVEVVDSQPDQWHVPDSSQDVHSYEPVLGGEGYRIVRGYREMTYEEARQKAKIDLTDYYLRYRNSQFTAAQITFDVTPDSTLLWIGDMLSTLRDRELGNSPVYYPPTVIDIDGTPHNVPDEASWHQFYDKFEKLAQDGANIARQAWVDIRGVSTTAEVQAIMAALPPVPGE